MSETPSRWADLGPRIISALVLAAVGLGAVWQGGAVFAALVAIACGAILWEVARMLAPGQPGPGQTLAVLGALAVLLAVFQPFAYAWLGIPVLALLAGALGGGEKPRAAIYVFWVLFAGVGLVALRGLGLHVILWLVALVVASDVLGYFAGRIIGGPKFWPKVSPKKTWAGTVAGWLGAGVVGWFFMSSLGPGAVWLSVILAFASQMGDAAESALKRHAGVKDSSALIPGHGGVFDRFDALLGAAFCLYAAILAGVLGG